APLHGVAARGGAGARPVGQARAARAAGRRAEPDRSAFGLPFPHALSVCRRALQGGTAGTAPSAAGPIGGLPSAIVHPELPGDSVEVAGLRSGCDATWCPRNHRQHVGARKLPYLLRQYLALSFLLLACQYSIHSSSVKSLSRLSRIFWASPLWRAYQVGL